MVDPHVAGFLARIHYGGDNNDIATFIDDSYPRVTSSGVEVGDVRGAVSLL
jgi:hypothetical protein